MGDIRSLASELYRSWVDIVSQESKKETINVIVTDQTQDGPVSLLQSLADEVSENLKKESETVEDDYVSPLKSRKVPTVIKPKSTIMDGSIKINKKNLPSNKKDKVKDKDKDKEKEKEREKRKRQENKEKERSKRFRPDGP